MKSPKFALLWERNPERNLYKFPFGAPSSCTIGMKLIKLPVDPLFCETNGTFSIQPSKQLYRDRDEASIYHCRVRTKISHILRSVLVQDSLSSRCLASSWSLMGTGELTEQPDEMLSKGLGGGNGGRNMSRTSIPAKGRIAILLVTSRYRNKNTLLLDRHRGSSTDLSLYALNKN